MMETIRTTYPGDLRTENIHVRSGTKIITDAPVDNKGKGEAFSPTDLLATSLGSCMVTTMGIAAQVHGFEMNGISLKITKVMSSDPRKVAEIIIEADMKNHTYSEKEKAVLMKAAETCPVALSLHPDLRQTVKFIFQD